MTDTAINTEVEQMGVDPAEYEALEKDFQEMLGELAGDESNEKYRKAYEKLHGAFKTVYESEKRLVKRCKELNNPIV